MNCSTFLTLQAITVAAVDMLREGRDNPGTLGRVNMNPLRSVAAVSLLSVFAFAGQHAPLPPQLMSAKTVYIENNTGQASFADKCYDELTKWGRFRVVSDPKQADLTFQIGARVHTYGYSGSRIPI